MRTRNGGNCFAIITCKDGGQRDYNAGESDWSSCWVGGRQYFTDPRIGDFSITFTKKDG